MKNKPLVIVAKKGEVTGVTKIVLGAIAIIIAITLIPVLSGSVNDAIGVGNGSDNPNLTGANVILLSLTVLIFVAFVIILAVKKFIQ